MWEEGEKKRKCEGGREGSKANDHKRDVWALGRRAGEASERRVAEDAEGQRS